MKRKWCTKKKSKKKVEYKPPTIKTYTEDDMINYCNYMVKKNQEETKQRQSAMAKKQEIARRKILMNLR